MGTTYSCVGYARGSLPSPPLGDDHHASFPFGRPYTDRESSLNSLQRNGRVEIIANDQGNRITPSYVGFAPSSGERLIGDGAKNQAPSNPTNTVFDAKRLIGRRFDDKEVQRDLKHYPFKVKAGTMQQPVVEVKVGEKSKTFTAEEISAMILGKMKETAETYLGHKVTHAVVTVPA